MRTSENKRGEVRRLLEFLAEIGIEPSTFAKEIGVSPRTLQNSIYDDKPLGSKLIRGVIEKSGSVDWLLTGNGSMHLLEQGFVRENSMSYSTSSELANNPDFYGLKLYKTLVSAGHGAKVENEEFTVLYFPLSWFQKRNLTPSHLVAVNVPGDSQEPSIPAGSVVLVDITETEIKNGKFYVFNVDDDLLIKKMYLDFDGYVAKSQNPIYDDIILTKDRIENLNIVGRGRWALPDFEI